MDAPSNSSSHTQIIEQTQPERRECRRTFASRDCPVTLRANSETARSAFVQDISMAGLAILVDDASEYVVGQSVEIEKRGGTVAGVIKHVVTESDGTHRIGLFWQEPKMASILALMKECGKR